MKYINADLLRKELERRKSLLTQHSKLTYDLILETFIKEYDDLLSFLDTLSEEPDKSLEEAAEDWVFENCFDCDVVGEHRAYDAFIAGAEWQASRMPMPEDTVLFNKGVAEGRRLEKEDMLKNAKDGYVSAVVIHNDGDEEHYAVTYPNGERPHSITDKVKIIIL